MGVCDGSPMRYSALCGVGQGGGAVLGNCGLDEDAVAVRRLGECNFYAQEFFNTAWASATVA